MPKQLSLPKSDSLQRLRLLAFGACASASLLALGTPAEAAPTYKAKTLATGLESPRGVAIAPNGNLVLSEAGRGGNGDCLIGGSGGQGWSSSSLLKSETGILEADRCPTGS